MDFALGYRLPQANHGRGRYLRVTQVEVPQAAQAVKLRQPGVGDPRSVQVKGRKLLAILEGDHTRIAYVGAA